MKIAFDVHGVLDTHEQYRDLLKSMADAGHTIYIISGQPLDEDMCEFLSKYRLSDYYDYYFSIETYLLESNTPYSEDEKGKFFDDVHWDSVKAKICERENIDMIFDNSPSYAAEFKSIRTHFNLVIDKNKRLGSRR